MQEVIKSIDIIIFTNVKKTEKIQTPTLWVHLIVQPKIWLMLVPDF